MRKDPLSFANTGFLPNLAFNAQRSRAARHCARLFFRVHLPYERGGVHSEVLQGEFVGAYAHGQPQELGVVEDGDAVLDVKEALDSGLL